MFIRASLNQKILGVIVGFVAATAMARPALADSFIVTMDTTPLQSIGGTWYLDFQLADGDGVVDNSVQITNLSVGTGSHLAVPGDAFTGDASGDFTSGYSLDDGTFFSEAIVPFSAGASVQFQLDYSNNFAPGAPQADTFSWGVLDSNQNSIVTDPNSLGKGLSIVLDGTNGTTGSITLVAADATLYNSIIPVLTPVQTVPPTVPEPMSAVLLATGLAFARRKMATRSRTGV